MPTVDRMFSGKFHNTFKPKFESESAYMEALNNIYSGTFFGFKNFVCSFGSICSWNEYPYVNGTFSCTSGISGGPVICATQPDYLVGIVCGGYKSEDFNHFLHSSHPAILEAYWRFALQLALM
jgi:hypothetical protein